MEDTANQRLIPITRSDAGTGHPYLANDALGLESALLWVDDQHFATLSGAAIVDRTTRQLFVCCALGLRCRTPKELVVAYIGDGSPTAIRGPIPMPAADEQGRLGQAIAGKEGPALEAVGGESLIKTLHNVAAHRLGAVECQAPAAQVEAPQGVFLHLAGA